MTDEYKQSFGQLCIARSTLEKVLRLISEDELDILRDELSETLSDLTQLWSDQLSPLQEGSLQELERLEFRLRHRKKFWPRKKPIEQKPYYICRKCDCAIIHVDFNKVTCPTCESYQWIELVFA